VITVRDEDSRVRLVERYGVTVPPVIATADPVLSMRVPGSAKIRSVLEDKRIATGGEPFVVINFAYGVDRRDQLLDFVARTTDHVVDAFGARVLVIPMNVTPNADRLGMEKVLNRAWDERRALRSQISQARSSLRTAASANAEYFRKLANQRA